MSRESGLLGFFDSHYHLFHFLGKNFKWLEDCKWNTANEAQSLPWQHCGYGCVTRKIDFIALQLLGRLYVSVQYVKYWGFWGLTGRWISPRAPRCWSRVMPEYSTSLQKWTLLVVSTLSSTSYFWAYLWMAWLILYRVLLLLRRLNCRADLKDYWPVYYQILSVLQWLRDKQHY